MTRFSSLPVREVIVEPGAAEPNWPFTLAPIAQLLRDGLELSELTILVGENGTGKSTIIEAIAIAYGLSPEGGSTFTKQSDRPTESPLHEHIRLVRGISRSRWGYFVRAETLHSLLTHLEKNPSWHRPEVSYHERSHGQAFNDLLATKLGHMVGRGGLLIMDEPEAGLSFLSQIALAHQLAGLRDHEVQVLLATHSPILAATPGATIIELDEDGFHHRNWQGAVRRHALPALPPRSRLLRAGMTRHHSQRSTPVRNATEAHVRSGCLLLVESVENP